MANPRLLKKGGIYRVNYSLWKTNPRPIIFIIYPGISKVHALSLNAPGITRIDTLAFINFIKKMKAIKNSHLYSPRLLYRILRQYFPNLVRKTYRTFFTASLGIFSLVSYGISKEEDYSDYEKAYYNKALYNEAKMSLLGRTLEALLPQEVKYTPAPKMPTYTLEQENIKKQNEELAKNKNKIIEKDGLEDVYGKE